MLFDPPINLRGDGADDHAAGALEHALMSAGGERPIGVGVQFDHRELQFLRGGLEGLRVFGPEPGGLVNAGFVGVP